ncbi:uncharacterized protein LOC134662889 [Cydia amplana]|uniref:uncharacterized protein LOC134649617 n=1 Tax=Cydia amplana TaxID=1869771 RepID=UPI002FE65712
MDPNFLLKDELEFELACRGVTIKSSVPVLKKLLRELMLGDTSGASGTGNKTVLGVSDKVTAELQTCASKLTVLSNYITEVVGKPDRNLFKRLVSRLYHVINRLSLVSSGSEAENEWQAELTQKAYSLLGKLEEQDDLTENEDLTEEDKKVLQETLGDVGQQIIVKLDSEREGTSKPKEVGLTKQVEEEARVNKGIDIREGQLGKAGSSRDKLIRTSTLDEDFSTRKLVPIAKWGIKFSGSNTSSVNAFIERVSELKEARNASDDDLWRCAIDFFEGDALIWYRANKEYAT